MIAKEFEEFLLSHWTTYLTPAEDLAIFVDTHNTDHVMLLLSRNGFSRVPVITKDRHYVGTISVSDIVNYQFEHELALEELADLDISHMVNKRLEAILPTADLTEIMHKLVDASFLPVVTADGYFKGIITRKAILKAINSLLHNFAGHYHLIPKKEVSDGQ
ncbi:MULTISPECIES: cyclic-di-AMP-binding protein CbpB [unclassified Streptococcus]|uniref:cyclic-di-AMP-binding protein CbpB n=1 Tax=unclassified Streptococcus TaxID=2608887 RepID=UPI00359E108E